MLIHLYFNQEDTDHCQGGRSIQFDNKLLVNEICTFVLTYQAEGCFYPSYTLNLQITKGHILQKMPNMMLIYVSVWHQEEGGERGRGPGSHGAGVRRQFDPSQESNPSRLWR